MVFLLGTSYPCAQEIPEKTEQDSIEDLMKKIKSAKDPKEFFEKVLVPMEKKDPNSKSVLDLAALALFSMKEFDRAEKYILKSLAVKKTDQSLNILIWICTANPDQRFNTIRNFLKDLEKMEEKNGIIIRTLLAIAYLDKDLKLYLRIVDYLTLENLDEKNVLRDLKTVGKRFREDESGDSAEE